MLGTRIISTGLTSLFLFTLFFAALPIQTAHADTKDVFEEVTTPACLAGTNTPLLITELQVGSPQNYRHEFLELVNCLDTELELAGYTVGFFTLTDSPITTVALTGSLAPAEQLVLMQSSYKNSLGDTLAGPYITYGTGNTNALLADGGTVTVAYDGVTITKVTYGGAAPIPVSGQSIKRCTVDGLFRDSGVSTDDFLLTPLPTLSFVYELGPPCLTTPEILDPDEDETDPDLPVMSCEGVVISEALPNPAGVDADKEFIELHNPTNDYIDLYGCALRLGSGNARYVFTESIELEPGQYAAFYDSVTGITLPNAAGGTISLVTAAGVETSVSYPANMADDTVWMQHDGVWQVSYAPSPNALNIVLPLKPCDAGQVRNEATGRCIAVAAALAELADCGEGRERNPETNRCRNIVIATTALADCGEGRERNPETNRCRNIASSTSALADCGEGRERNPETNRCRNVASASTALADCGEGRERNPETNRCRNIVASSSDIPTVRDVATGERADMTGWWVAGGVLLLAAGYGIYEWRKDIMRWITQRLPLRRR